MTLMNLTAGKWVSKAIAVAAELGIPDLLKDRPRTAAEIARTASASKDGVYRLLRALASVGLFAETGHRKFRLTPLGRLLRTDSFQALGGYARFVGDQSTWRPWGELRHSVQTGEPAFDRVFAMPVFKYFAKMPESAAVFDAAMTSISTWESKAVVAGYDFSGINTLVDVAGGHGLMLATILKANRKMRGILFDLPHVVAGATALLQSAGVADRCEIVSGDFFASIPEGSDAYIMKHIIHDWSDEHCRTILKLMRDKLPPDGRVFVCEMVVTDEPGPTPAKMLDIEMLVLTVGGKERTKDEFAELFASSGLRLSRIVPTERPICVIEAVPGQL
jgi:O-methyltransferase domain/Dimerisation domain